MQQREKLLAIVAATVVALWIGLPVVQRVYFAPIEEKRLALENANANLAEQATESAKVINAGKSLKQWRSRSLPADPLDAQRLYQAWLTDIAQMAGFADLKVTPGRRTPKGSTYTTVQVSLTGDLKFSQLVPFLYDFHRIDLAHRIAELSIKPTGNQGDPTLHITLNAEGLCVSGTEPRRTLFPQSTLAADFRSTSGSQQIRVNDSESFPKQTPFRIRIGREYLTVTSRNDDEWRVEGGVDATNASAHDEGDLIELAPIAPEYTDVSLQQFRELIERSPFVIPSPPSPTPPPYEPRPTTIVRDDTASRTYLAACIIEDDDPQAWLYNDSNLERTLLREGMSVRIGAVEANILEIRSSSLVLATDSGKWQLNLGETLTQLHKLADDMPQKQAATTPDQVLWAKWILETVVKSVRHAFLRQPD